MIKSELIEKLNNIPDDGDVLETLRGIEGVNKPFDFNNMELDQFKDLITNNQKINGYYQSTLDSKVSKGINTYKENFEKNQLPKIIEEELKKHSNKGKTPEQIQLEQVMAELEAMKKEKALADKKDSIGKELVTNGLPMELLGFLNWEAEDSIIKEQAKTINDLISKAVSEGIKAELTKNNPQPRKSEGNGEEDEFTLAMRKLHGDLF